MQQELTESPEQRSHFNSLDNPPSSSQHGPIYQNASELYRLDTESRTSDSQRHAFVGDCDSSTGFSVDQLDEKLLGLSFANKPRTSAQNPGQRISDYENALTPPTARQAMGFKVIKRAEPRTDGLQLEDFPNEILTHILSHLHPDSHATVALVNKRFYALVTMPYAWRMAFLRYFPGHTIIKNKSDKDAGDVRIKAKSETFRSDTRFFPRLTQLATWRSEYLFRTRLLRGLERGKPGTQSTGIGSSGRTKTSRKSSAVLTYNSKLPWLVTNIHAVFTNGKKPPRSLQGTADLGVGTMSDPTTGKVEKWGLESPTTFQQLEEVMPNVVPFGLGEGPAAAPNVMDVSQPYGLLAGEGFPGGLAFFRGASEMRGRYLTADSGVADTYSDIPKIPEMSEGISSVWLAKSSSVPSVTQSMVGMLVGSTLGVVTAYSLGWESSGLRFSNGDMTARWVLSPGVPIISLKVDENYSVKRKTAGRIWAVALNALGEVFYLTEFPTTTLDRTQGDDIVKNAWLAGRSVYWHLLEETRRVALPDELDKNVVRGGYSPRSPSDYVKLSKDQMTAEAREIEKFLRYKPSHFIRVCQGWDMRRKLEVDFANDDGKGAGESIFVFDCGLAEGSATRIIRYMRTTDLKTGASPELQPKPHSLFGPINGEDVKPLESQSPKSPPPTPLTPGARPPLPEHEWYAQCLALRNHSSSIISTTALDYSSQSVLTLTEDALHVAGKSSSISETPTAEEAPVEIPGRRARYLAVGTNSGAVVVWNAREPSNVSEVVPVRIIQTDSPEISSLGVSALYLVHGGSDGLVQAWDPLGSTTEAIRTINGRSNGRVPRHMMIMNPVLAEANYSAAGAIFLDPDPTVLRGIVSFGAFMRYWSYSSTGHTAGRKRRVRHSDIHGRLASRRQGGTSSRYIAAEEAELRREDAELTKERNHLRKRFGVGALGDLTEEEALRYAEMISQEAFQQEEEQRRTSDSAEASLDTASSFSEATTDTITPEPSVAAPSPLLAGVPEGDEYEEQIQQAIRLSLLEGVNEPSHSPRDNSSGEYEFSIKYKPKSNKKFKSSRSPSSSHAGYTTSAAGSSSRPTDPDEDLALAISLSMQEQELVMSENQAMVETEEFPALDTEGVGKGKGVQRW